MGYPGYNFGGSQMGQMPGQLPGMGQMQPLQQPQMGQMPTMGAQQQMPQQQMQPLGMGGQQSRFGLPSGQFQMPPMLGQNMMQRYQQWAQMFPQYSGMGGMGGLGALAGWGLHRMGAF